MNALNAMDYAFSAKLSLISFLSPRLREKLDERFYATEFEYIRSLETEPKSENKQKVKSKYSQEEDEEEESTLASFDLLKKFQSLEQSEKNKIGKLHHSVPFYSHKTNKGTNKLIKDVLKLDCSCDRCSGTDTKMTRQKKNSNLVLTNICDVRLKY